MRAKSMVLILIAAACGLVASIGISQVMESGGLRGGPTPTEKIYVAMSHIEIGKKLDENNLKLEAWPKDKIPQGAAKNLDEIKDKYPRQRFYPGEPILVAKLTDNPGANAIKIPEGHRVVSVKVDVSTINTALLSPGDFIDLLVFLRKNQDIPQTIAKTVLRNVCVFAVGSETERTVDKDGKAVAAQTVSLVVTPPQGRKVLLAMELGRLQLVMRRPDDTTVESDADESETSLDQILGKAAESAEPKLPPASNKNESFLDMLQRLGGGAGSKSTPLPTEPLADAGFTVIVMNPEGQDVYQFQTPGELPKKISSTTGPQPSAPDKRSADPRQLIGHPLEIAGDTTTDEAPLNWISYRGKTVLVMVWNSTCPASRAEMPIVARTFDSYRDQGLDVLGVSLDKDPLALGKFVTDAQIPWTTLYGREAPQLVTRWGITSTPFFILVGADGKVLAVGHHVAELAVSIDSALKGLTGKASRSDETANNAGRPDEPGGDDVGPADKGAGSSKEE